MGTLLSQVSWFLKVFFGHHIFSSTVVSLRCFWALCFLKRCGLLVLLWALCFFKCHGFLTLFVGNVFSQAPWFINVISRRHAFSRTLVFQPCFLALWFFKDCDFLALFFQHCVFSSTTFFWLLLLMLHFVLPFELCL